MELILTEEPWYQSIATRIWALKTGLPRKYSIVNLSILRDRFAEYSALISDVGHINETAKRNLQSNLAKLEQRFSKINQPGNTIAASRYYFSEAVNFLVVELITMAQMVTETLGKIV